MKAAIGVGKERDARAAKAVPGGKLVSYSARNQALIIHLGVVPNVDSLIPVCEQMNMIGWDTEIIPIEKTADAIPKMEKALAEMAKR